MASSQVLKSLAKGGTENGAVAGVEQGTLSEDGKFYSMFVCQWA